MKFIDVDQNSEEWMDLRMGKLTGSSMSKVMASPNEYKVLLIEKDSYAIANTKSKKLLKKRYKGQLQAHNALTEMMKKDISKSFGVPAKQLAVTIAREQITGCRPLAGSYSNAHMERGHEQEPRARALYEAENFVEVTNGGFFDCGNCGCSPDGLVYDDGLIEIKSVIDHVHYANINRDNIDPSYQWQIYFNLLKTERKWIDFVSYCEDYPENNRLFTYRVNSADCTDKFDMIKARSTEFFSLVDEIKLSMEK